VAAVHAEIFGAVAPAATMVEVSALIAPELLVEIEVDAYLDGDSTGNTPS
jgi:enamine deaminase RidA (YjgF/YER057c/UK114 family)